MKKLLSIALALVLILCAFAGCSKNKQEQTTQAQTTQAQQTTTAAEGGEEDGQNPVMNFIGKYDNGGTYITVECEGKDGAKFTVEEPMTDTEKYTYSFSGTLDLDTLKVTYSNSTKKVQTLGDYGKVVDEKTEYTDGAGVVIFHDDGTLEWQDENEADRLLDNNVFSFVTG